MPSFLVSGPAAAAVVYTSEHIWLPLFVSAKCIDARMASVFPAFYDLPCLALSTACEDRYALTSLGDFDLNPRRVRARSAE